MHIWTSSLLLSLIIIAPSLATWNTFTSSNAVNDCGSECTNTTPPFVCLGSFPTEAECFSRASMSSDVFTWSSYSKHCWTRTDHLWTTITADGDIAGCNNATVTGCVTPSPRPITSNLTISLSAAAVSKTHALHPALALDFWRSDDPRFGVKWGNSSAITIDLTDPVLRAAASALAPAILRLGGSPDDSVIFDTDGSCIPQSGGDGPFPGYYCSQVHPCELLLLISPLRY